MLNPSKVYYCVHVLVSVRYREPRPGDTIYLYENVMLLECKDETVDPWDTAESQARLNYTESECFLEDRPSFEKFEGIRKIVSVQAPELTYLQMEVASEKEIEALLGRKPVKIVCYDDDFPEDN